MKKLHVTTFICFVCSFSCNVNVLGQQLPSDKYYNEHIATDNIIARSPSLRAGDDDLDPGGSTEGEGGFVGEVPVNGSSIIPFLVFAGLYTVFIFWRKKNNENNI